MTLEEAQRFVQRMIMAEKIPGGLAKGKKPSDFDKEQLEKGIKVELEHSDDDRDLAREIAMDHLVEDPKYYDKLEKIEKHGTRQAATLADIERPAQDLVNLCRDLYRLAGRIEAAGKRMKVSRPALAMGVLKQVQPIDRLARKLSMYVDDYLDIY